MMRRVSYAAAILAALAGCGGGNEPSPAAPAPAKRAAFDPAVCGGTVEVHSAADLQRASGCTTIAGDLVVRTGADVSLRELTALERIDGNLRVGPTLAFTSIDGLDALASIGGALEIDGNALMTTVSLTALREVGGGVTIHRNASLTSVSAPVLSRVQGGLVVAGNADLFHVGFTALERIGGAFEVSGNGRLELLDVPVLATVGDRVVIERNRTLNADEVEALVRRLSGPGSTGGEIAPSVD